MIGIKPRGLVIVLGNEFTIEGASSGSDGRHIRRSYTRVS